MFFRAPDLDDSSRIISPIKRSNDKNNKRADEKKKNEICSPKVPAGVEDFDKENLLDPIQVSDYAMDIFEYMKRREKLFLVKDYMPQQVCIVLYFFFFHKIISFKFFFFLYNVLALKFMYVMAELPCFPKTFQCS